MTTKIALEVEQGVSFISLFGTLPHHSTMFKLGNILEPSSSCEKHLGVAGRQGGDRSLNLKHHGILLEHV